MRRAGNAVATHDTRLIRDAGLLRKPCRGEAEETGTQRPGTCPLRLPASRNDEEPGESTFPFKALC